MGALRTMWQYQLGRQKQDLALDILGMEKPLLRWRPLRPDQAHVLLVFQRLHIPSVSLMHSLTPQFILSLVCHCLASRYRSGQNEHGPDHVDVLFNDGRATVNK